MTTTTMRRFKSKHSQKASEDWFLKNICQTEEDPQPSPSKDDNSGDFEETTLPRSVLSGGGSSSRRDEGGFEYHPSIPSSFCFRGGISHGSELLRPKKQTEKSLDEHARAAPTDDFGPIIFGLQKGQRSEEELHNFEDHVLLRPTDISESPSSGEEGDKDDKLVSENETGSRDEHAVVQPVDTIRTYSFGGGMMGETEVAGHSWDEHVVMPTRPTATGNFGGRSDQETEESGYSWNAHVVVPPGDDFIPRMTEIKEGLFGGGEYVQMIPTRWSESIFDEWQPDNKAEEEESEDEYTQKKLIDGIGIGTICFVGMGNKEAEFVRVSSAARPDKLYKLLIENWKLRPPNLLISVTGGAKNFYLKPHLKNMFHRGLIQVAQTTGAWILTGGTNTGVVRHVGQAVRDQALSSSMNGHIVAIGIATWGTIHNRHMLVNPKELPNSMGFWHGKYVVDVEGQGELRCLDHNHTHFLLVNDGTQGEYGAEIKLRARLVKYISGKDLTNQESGVKIPVVNVMLNGDPDTLNTMYNAILNGTPCVVLEGSGRMADVIAHVAELPMKQVTIALITELMKKFFGQEYKGFLRIDIIAWTKKIQDIIRMPHLLTVFRVNADSDEHVDVAILQALLKASKSGEDNESNQRQLELAVAWNRADIAKTQLFTDEGQWKTEQLHCAMFSALIGNKPEFVSLLLENGVSLNDFLQKKILYDLYRKLPNCLFLRRIAKRKRSRPATNKDEDPFIPCASSEAYQLLKSYNLPILPNHTVNLADMEMSPASVSENFLKSTNPERDLFLWAILHNNKEVAEIAWEECQDCIATALAASKMLKKLGGEISRDEDTDEAKRLMELASLYEKRAIDVFTQCYSSDEERAQKLLLRVSPLWDRTTCLTLALEADNQNFIAQSGVQALLTQIWCGELSVENPAWRVFVCIFFFPLIYTPFVDFRRDEDIQKGKEKKEVTKALEKITKIHEDENELQEVQLKPLGGCERLVALYRSLQVKFYMHIVSYFAFLILFAVVLMVDFHPSPSISEILLYFWIFTLACEEIRQLFYDPEGLGCLKKAKLYIYDLWNVLDVLSIFLFIIGLALRLTDGLVYAGKIVLCIDYVIFCLRLMAIFTINQTLGPKIIIVRRMMKDMFFFMFLLSIWVVAYGVAKQGILINNENRLSWILRGAVYEPYLTIFGNMPSNIDHSGFEIGTCSLNGSDPLKPKCPELNESEMPVFPEWLTIIMLSVYLLFANILLLNLLIAILSFTFQEVQDNTDRIWKFQRYELINEYHSRPIAPPPFILFSHLYMLLQEFKKACTNPREHRSVRKSEELSQEEDELLLYWEAVMKDRYLASTEQEQIQSTERKIQDTAHKVSAIWDRLDREEDPSFSSVDKRLARLEKQVSQLSQLVRAQQRNNNSVESVIGKTDYGLPLNRTLSTDIPDFHLSPIHVNACHLPYANMKVIRFPVPEEKVPWKVSFRCYNPPYVSRRTKDKMDRSEFQNLDHFRNPVGRTGLGGCGALSCLGPNRILDFILTRWRNYYHLEFLVFKENENLWKFPGGEEDSPECLPATLRKTINEMKAKRVYLGYVDDHRNTDNAWVDSEVLTLDLTDSPVLTDINTLVMQTQGSDLSFEWHEVSEKTKLSSHHRDCLKRVEHLLNSF